MSEGCRWTMKNHFSCTECHKPFFTKKSYYLHAEDCLLVGLENELLSVQQQQQPSTSTATQAIIIKSLQYQPFEQVSRMGAVKKPSITAPPPGITIKTSTREPAKEEYVKMSMQRELEHNWMEEQEEEEGQLEERQQTSESLEGMAVLERVESETPEPSLKQPTIEEEQVERGREPAEEDLPPPLETEVVYEEDDEDGEEAERHGQEGEEEEDTVDFHYIPVPSQVIGALANSADDTGKPKIECPTCGLILYRHNFSSHFRIHTGEMPYLCPHCFKKFRTSSSRKIHVRSHTGEKPYSCPSCHYATITKRNLDRHIINHHVRTDGTRGSATRRSRYPILNEEAREEEEEEIPQRRSMRRVSRRDEMEEVLEEEQFIDFPDEVFEEVVVGTEYLVEQSEGM